MQFSKIFLSFLVLGIIISMGMTNAFGHGLGFEVMPPEMLGSKLVSLEISSDILSDKDAKEIIFTLFETDTGVTVKDVTYFIMLTKQNEVLFDITAQRDDGALVLKLLTTESDQISIEEEGKICFSAFFCVASNAVNVKGNAFGLGGLYNFKVIITTADSYSNVLSPPLDYDVGISFFDKTLHDINDINFGQQQLDVITYYDLISDDFNYDSSKKIISYSMPFDWSEKNIEQISVVHQEIRIPKTLGDLMVKSFSANVNGLKVQDSVIIIDDFSAENRVVHLILNQNYISQLSKKIQDYPSKMYFSIMPSAENLPLTTMTENAQFRINLSWEPQNIESGSKTTFFFDILDAFLVDRPVSVSYDLSIFHDDEKIFQTSGVSNDFGHNVIEFDVPDDVMGVVTLQFENLNGSDLANAVLPVVVDRVNIDETSIPVWIKNNAGWWADGQIDDSSFLQGIQYLIKEGIMVIPPTETTEASESQEVPSWIKNNAGWWADGQIDDETFVSGIQYLIKVGVIKVS